MSQTRLCLHVLTRSPQRLPAAFFPVASLRAVTDALHYEDSLFVPRDRQLAKCTLLTGDVTGVDADGRTVTFTDANGATVSVPFDLLVIATGISYGAPARAIGATVEAAKASIVAQRAAVAAASRILIVGGGPVGVELAGELASLKGKAITLVHSGSHLVSSAFSNGAAIGNDKRLGEALAAQATAAGVRVVLNQRVLHPGAVVAGGGDAAAVAADLKVVAPGVYAGDASVTTSAGEKIEADLQFWVNRGTPNTAFLKGSGLPLDAAGFVSVEPSLQVVGQPRIFAIGDCAASGLPKTVMAIKFSHSAAAVANLHAAAVTAANPSKPAPLVVAKVRPANPPPLTPYPPVTQSPLHIPRIPLSTAPAGRLSRHAGHLWAQGRRRPAGIVCAGQVDGEDEVR